MTHRVLLVLGSRTREDKYGTTSGRRVADALKRRGWKVESVHAADGAAILRRLCDSPRNIDLVIPIGFGAPCEDGEVCAVARMAGVPCAGPTPGAGGIMQDKSALSMMVDALFPLGSGVRSPRGTVLTDGLTSANAEMRVRPLAPPLVVKPAFAGSSESLTVCGTRSEALGAATSIIAYEGKVVVQQLEAPLLAEISCTVLDDRDGPHFLPIVELRRDAELVLGPEEKFGA